MRRADSRAGLTLVEVMIAMFLVSIAAVIVYTEMLMAYRILMRSRARLEAQTIAFDSLWQIYNAPLTNMPVISLTYTNFPTPEWSLLSTNGWVECLILAETNPPTVPDPIRYWDIVVQVWAPSNSPLQLGTNASLSRYAVRRYWGER